MTFHGTSNARIPVQQLSAGHKFRDNVHLAWANVHSVELDAVWMRHLRPICKVEYGRISGCSCSMFNIQIDNFLFVDQLKDARLVVCLMFCPNAQAAIED